MAKKAYVGVNGVARNVKNIYVGVNGVARKVVKGYVGVNGVARLFWDGGVTPVISDSWDYWTSVSGVFLENTDHDVAIKKVNNKIAYYGLAVMQNYNPQYPDAVYILISPDPDAVSVKYIYSGQEDSRVYPYNSTTTDANGITWYVNAFRYYMQFDITQPDEWSKPCYINTWDDPYPDTAQGKADAIQDMLDKIYSSSFHEDYQADTRYDLNVTSLKKALRKTIGTFLFTTISYSNDTRYITLSDNADTIISDILSNHAEDDTRTGSCRLFARFNNSSANLNVYVTSCLKSDATLNVYVNRKNQRHNFEFYEITPNVVDRYAPSLSNYGTGIAPDGTMSPIHVTDAQVEQKTIGFFEESIGQTQPVTYGSNWGIDL